MIIKHDPIMINILTSWVRYSCRFSHDYIAVMCTEYDDLEVVSMHIENLTGGDYEADAAYMFIKENLIYASGNTHIEAVENLMKENSLLE